MPITRRGKSWQASAHYKGKRMRRSFNNYEDAQRFEAEALASLLSGKGLNTICQPLTNPPMTFGGAAKRV